MVTLLFFSLFLHLFVLFSILLLLRFSSTSKKSKSFREPWINTCFWLCDKWEEEKKERGGGGAKVQLSCRSLKKRKRLGGGGGGGGCVVNNCECRGYILRVRYGLAFFEVFLFWGFLSFFRFVWFSVFFYVLCLISCSFSVFFFGYTFSHFMIRFSTLPFLFLLFQPFLRFFG